MERDTPTYDLQWIQYRLEAGDYWIERLAAQGAMSLNFDQQDIIECVLGLTANDFYKSMESEKRPGLWQDVYKPLYCGVGIYAKIQIGHAGDCVVIQFKKDESYGK
jgi:motility quorum-sensing regulator / GCU-specific mRNA interferase toxin